MSVGAFVRSCSASWVALCIAIVGCGGGDPQYTVTGKVVEGGQPIVIEMYEEGGSCLEVEFFPLDEGGALASDAVSHIAFCAEDGSFQMYGAEGEGIPPGKYRVAVRRLGETEDESGDMWGGKFDGDKSPFVVDVPSSEDIVIDIAKAQAE